MVSESRWIGGDNLFSPNFPTERKKEKKQTPGETPKDKCYKAEAIAIEFVKQLALV